MKNLPKYLEDENEGLFSFDFLQKTFMAAFVWKQIIADHACKSLVSKRRKHLKNKDDKEYRECIKQMHAYEEKAFESALDKVKRTTQIIDRNF